MRALRIKALIEIIMRLVTARGGDFTSELPLLTKSRLKRGSTRSTPEQGGTVRFGRNSPPEQRTVTNGLAGRTGPF